MFSAALQLEQPFFPDAHLLHLSQWSEQSHMPLLYKRRTAQMVHANTSATNMMVAGVSCNSCSMLLLSAQILCQNDPISPSHWVTIGSKRPKYPVPLGHAAVPLAFSLPCALAFSSTLYFGIGRNSRNSMNAATATAITVQRLNATSPAARPPS